MKTTIIDEPKIEIRSISTYMNDTNEGFYSSTDGGSVGPLICQDILYLNPPLLVKDRVQMFWRNRDPYVVFEIINTHQWIDNFLVYVSRYITQQDPKAPVIIYIAYLIKTGFDVQCSAMMGEAPSVSGISIYVDFVGMNTLIFYDIKPNVKQSKITESIKIIKQYYPEFPN